MLEVNLSVWNSVAETDKRFCKDFRRVGGYQGTAINPMYSVLKATRLWGPIGGRWGVDLIDEKYVEGMPLFDANGNLLCRESIHTVIINLWYPLPDGIERHEGGKVGCVTHSGATTVVGQHSDRRLFSDEEHRKKSLTDAMSKALSVLGFSADIYLGPAGFEASKYLHNPQSADQQKPAQAPIVPPNERAASAIAAAIDANAIKRIQAHYRKLGLEPSQVKELDVMCELKLLKISASATVS